MRITPFLCLSPRRCIYSGVLALLFYLTLYRFRQSKGSIDDSPRPEFFRLKSSTANEDSLERLLRDMEHNFRIYIYDLDNVKDKDGNFPFRLTTQQCGISTGNNKGYGVERYFVEAIATSSFVTTDPMRADMFLIPVLPCPAKFQHYTSKLSKNENHERGKVFSQDYVTAAVKYIAKTHPYYNGTRPHLSSDAREVLPFGRDHFWFSTHDGGATRGLGVGGGFLENSVALVNTADEAMEFRPCWHISLPCNCDFGRPPPLDQRDFLFSGKVRQNQVFFAGNMGSNLLRQTVQQSVQGDSFFRIVSGRMDDKDYTYMLRTSQFCLHLRGFQVWSPRLIEYLWYGCIPVVLGDDYYLPYSSLFDWDQFSIRICEKDADKIKDILLAIDSSRIAELRANLKKVAHHFTFHSPPQFGDAFYMAMYALYVRHKLNVQAGNVGAIATDGEQSLVCDERKLDCVV